MNRLRLAEPGYLSSPMQLSNPNMMLSDFDISEYYLNVPTDDGGIVKVREDFLDNYNDEEFAAIMDVLEPYQEKTMSGLFSGLRERIQTRREQRKTVDPETGLTQRQTYKLQRQAQRGETIGKMVDAVKGIFGGGSSQQEPDLRQLNIQGGLGFESQQSPPQGSNTKTALIIGGSALALILIYKMMKKK